MALELEARDGRFVVTGDAYSFVLSHDPQVLSLDPYAHLLDAAGRRWSKLSLLCSVSTTAGPDETFAVTAVTATESADGVLITVAQASSHWVTRTLELHCAAGSVAAKVIVEGAGSIVELSLLGGEATLEGGACGTFRSSIKFSSLLVPVPTEPVQFVRPAHSAAVLGIVGDADGGRLNGIFSPPPLVLGFGREAPTSPIDPPGGDWLSVGVRAPVDELTFTMLRYEPLDGGFVLRFAYEGHTRARGQWASPQVVISPVASGWEVVDAHRADLVEHGFAPKEPTAGPSWWLEPIFCGWGAQSARGATEGRLDELHPLYHDGIPGHVFATEALYDEFLVGLDLAGLDPGTIVIDDRWQRNYGTATPDDDRWPDLKRWIAGQHDRGRRVLLWWKAWDCDGLPVDECVTDAAGRRISVDPANPTYLARLRSIVTALLSPGGMDADGLKVDFTQRAPSGRSLTAHAGPWGVAALHAMLSTMYEAAHAAKADALVVTHAVHPSFAGAGDMVRLNDVLERDVANTPVPVADQLRARFEIASRSQPGVPIDTDQWPMSSKAEWLEYVEAQAAFGVPALYYLESIDRSAERIEPADLARVAESWKGYRQRHGLPAR